MYCYGEVKLPLPGDKENIHDRHGMIPNSFSEFKKQYIWVSSPSCNNSVEYFVSLCQTGDIRFLEETADGPGQSFLAGRHSICSLEFLWTCIHSIFQLNISKLNILKMKDYEKQLEKTLLMFLTQRQIWIEKERVFFFIYWF